MKHGVQGRALPSAGLSLDSKHVLHGRINQTLINKTLCSPGPEQHQEMPACCCQFPPQLLTTAPQTALSSSPVRPDSALHIPPMCSARCSPSLSTPCQEEGCSASLQNLCRVPGKYKNLVTKPMQVSRLHSQIFLEELWGSESWRRKLRTPFPSTLPGSSTTQPNQLLQDSSPLLASD